MSQEQDKYMSQNFYRASAADFLKIPGSPVAYWLSESVRTAFSLFPPLREISTPRQGNTTTNNARFVRLWPEVSRVKIGIGCLNSKIFNESGFKWAPYNKGGGSRRWYGQNESLVNWYCNGTEIKEIPHSVIANESCYFSPGITWSTISTSVIGFRYFGNGFIFDNKGACIFVDGDIQRYLLPVLNSKVFVSVLYQINPTVSLQPGDVAKFPVYPSKNIGDSIALEKSDMCVKISRNDWDSYETSWDFSAIPLITYSHDQKSIEASYHGLRIHWREMTLEMQRLEEENNTLFINAYCLQDEISPEVPLGEITLTCNPHYRYGGNKSHEELETMLQCDTMEELVSYAIGCMMGRYSLDMPGLVLASQGETLQDYLRQIPAPRFAPDDDGIIPLTDQEWFADDATNRLREFVRTAWGEKTLQENLDFVAESLCLHAIKPKKGEDSLDTIRRYLSSQFYKDHLRTYKKRPIYWLFSSGKHKAFECLIYLHRYNEGSLARMRTEYVIPLTAKLNAHANKLEKDIDASSSTAEKKALEKQLATLHNQQAELATFDEKLRHYADQRIRLDLDDGVRVNYRKFGDLLAEVNAITGGSDE